MGAENLVPVEIPVPPELAARLRSLPAAEMDRLRAVLEVFATPKASPSEAFSDFFRRSDPEIEASGLTDEIVEAEIAAYNAERRR